MGIDDFNMAFVPEEAKKVRKKLDLDYEEYKEVRWTEVRDEGAKLTMTFEQFAMLMGQKERRINNIARPHLVALGILEDGEELLVRHPAQWLQDFEMCAENTDAEVLAMMAGPDKFDRAALQQVAEHTFLRYAIGADHMTDDLVKISDLAKAESDRRHSELRSADEPF